MSEKKFKIDTNVVVDREAFGKKSAHERVCGHLKRVTLESL